jgi:Cu-Zn family superoxide dismutase
LVSFLSLGVSVASAQSQQAPLTASADLRDGSGKQVATASLIQASDQVQITFSFPNTGALAGTHAVHIHERGSCGGVGFAEAGGIFNPFGKQHGLLNPQGPMAGDLPDLTLGETGLARYNIAAPLATLRPGPASLLNPTGTALVIDSGIDDNKSQPLGNSGTPLACGVILPGGQAAAIVTPSSSNAVFSPLVIGLIGLILIFVGLAVKWRWPQRRQNRVGV